MSFDDDLKKKNAHEEWNYERLFGTITFDTENNSWLSSHLITNYDLYHLLFLTWDLNSAIPMWLWTAVTVCTSITDGNQHQGHGVCGQLNMPIHAVLPLMKSVT